MKKRDFHTIKKYFLIMIAIFSFLVVSKSAFASEATASNWDEFKAAYEDQTTTKITLKDDISYLGGTYLAIRTSSIEIDGKKEGTTGDYQNYSLTLGSTSLRIGKPTDDSGYASMTLSNITVSNTGDDGVGTNAGFISTVNGYDTSNAYQYGQYWTFNFQNIYVPKGRTSRLTRTPRAQINFSGTNYVSTTAENFYLGGINFADNTQYYGEITLRDYSIIWFRSKVGSEDTGSGDFIVGNNCDVKLRNTGGGTGYPSIYSYFRNILIGEGSKFTSTVPGSALQFSGNGQQFVAKKDSVVTLTSLNSYPSIQDKQVNYTDAASSNSPNPILTWNNRYATGLNMSFEKDSSLFIIGSTTSASNSLIQLGTTSDSVNNVITLNTPKQFDIRNNGLNNNNRFDAIQVTNSGSGNSLSILNSNLSFWKLGSSFSSSADLNYSDVASWTISKGNQVTSSIDDLTTSLNALTTTSRFNIARVTGLNTAPTVEWQYTITDANLQLSNMARVILGEVPDDAGLDANGNLSFIKQYANSGIPVTITNNQDDEELTLNTDSSGYISTTLDDYYKVGRVLTAVATRGKLVSDSAVSDAVFKITPPTPATVTAGKVYNTDTKLVGTGAEPGATLSVTLNGTLLGDTVVVNDDGSFTFPLNSTLSVGDVIKLYLQDHVGVAPEKLLSLPAPVTNNSTGNINPTTTLVYSDATFPAATSYVVEQGKANVLIQFQNEAGTILEGYSLTAGESTDNDISTPIFIGDEIDLTSITFKKVQEQIENLEKAGFEITERPANETKISITGVSQTITYKVTGQLFLQSAPEKINFGTITFNAKVQEVNNPTKTGDDLIITDTRASKTGGWTLSAKLTQEMKNPDTGSIMSEALRYVTADGDTIILNSGNQAVVQNTAGGTSNITNSWSGTATDPGLKLVADPNKTSISSRGSYSGEITWTIMQGQP